MGEKRIGGLRRQAVKGDVYIDTFDQNVWLQKRQSFIVDLTASRQKIVLLWSSTVHPFDGFAAIDTIAVVVVNIAIREEILVDLESKLAREIQESCL